MSHHDTLGTEAFRAIDRMREAWSARITGGLSPAALALALFDWSIHLASGAGEASGAYRQGGAEKRPAVGLSLRRQSR
jgi:hypothetical protein